MSAIKDLYRTQGLGGFFVGFVPTAARQGIAMGIRFALYDEMKTVIGKVCKREDGTTSLSKPIQLLVAGKISIV